MKPLLIISLFLSQACLAQESLMQLGQTVAWHSANAKDRATSIQEELQKADQYFNSWMGVQPEYQMYVLSPEDWKKYAHPQIIYGMPHYNGKGQLIVAAEDNIFWKRNTPSLDRLSQESAKQMKETYGNPPSLMSAFDLLAIHELGHVYQQKAGMVKQRNWLNELLCNILLHTYLAENHEERIPNILVFAKSNIEAFPPDRLKYTALKDFDEKYNELGTQHPDNYGWYQCQFHAKAGDIYDSIGEEGVKKLWNTLLSLKTLLPDEELNQVLYSVHPGLEKVLKEW